jgi:hypothetical protein
MKLELHHLGVSTGLGKQRFSYINALLLLFSRVHCSAYLLL